MAASPCCPPPPPPPLVVDNNTMWFESQLSWHYVSFIIIFSTFWLVCSSHHHLLAKVQIHVNCTVHCEQSLAHTAWWNSKNISNDLKRKELEWGQLIWLDGVKKTIWNESIHWNMFLLLSLRKNKQSYCYQVLADWYHISTFPWPEKNENKYFKLIVHKGYGQT